MKQRNSLIPTHTHTAWNFQARRNRELVSDQLRRAESAIMQILTNAMSAKRLGLQLSTITLHGLFGHATFPYVNNFNLSTLHYVDAP